MAPFLIQNLHEGYPEPHFDFPQGQHDDGDCVEMLLLEERTRSRPAPMPRCREFSLQLGQSERGASDIV